MYLILDQKSCLNRFLKQTLLRKTVFVYIYAAGAFIFQAKLKNDGTITFVYLKVRGLQSGLNIGHIFIQCCLRYVFNLHY